MFHCHQAGHTYRRCPSMTEEQKKQRQKKSRKMLKKQLKEENKEDKEMLKGNVYKMKFKERQNLPISKYTVSNPMDYEVVIYWTFSKPEYGNTYTARVFSY